MGTQYILQPNGLWARYSTCSDWLICVNMTEEEVVEQAVSEVVHEEKERIKKYLKDKKEGKQISQFSVSWEQAVVDTRKRSKDCHAFLITLDEIGVFPNE